MAALSLVESVGAAAIQAVAVAGMTATLTLCSHIAHEMWTLHAEMASRQQIESLLESWAARAAALPGAVPPLRDAGPRTLRIEADIDGDGRIDRQSEETVTLSLGPADAAGNDRGGSALALRHAIGRQSMTVTNAIEPGGVFDRFDVGGRRTDAAGAVRLVRVPLAGAPLFFAVPVASER